MKEELSDSTMEALYGATSKSPKPQSAKSKKEGEHSRRHHHHHRGAKPFSQGNSYRPYILVGGVSVALVLILYIIS